MLKALENLRLVAFIIKETVDEIIAELRKNVEHGDLQIMNLLVNYPAAKDGGASVPISSPL